MVTKPTEDHPAIKCSQCGTEEQFRVVSNAPFTMSNETVKLHRIRLECMVCKDVIEAVFSCLNTADFSFRECRWCHETI